MGIEQGVIKFSKNFTTCEGAVVRILWIIFVPRALFSHLVRLDVDGSRK